MGDPNGAVSPGARQDPLRLGWPYRIGAVCTALIVAFIAFTASLCGLAGDTASELHKARCGSMIPLLPLLGFVVLGLGIKTAKRLEKRWLAWAVLALALVPGVIAWKLLSV